MKKRISLLLVALSVLSMAGCAGAGETSVPDTSKPPKTQITSTAPAIPDDTVKVDYRLYEGAAPYASTYTQEETVSMTGYFIDDGKEHGAVVILPGGGFIHRSEPKEGEDIAALVLNEYNMNAIVVHYRLTPCYFKGIAYDAIRAVKLLRSMAEERNVNEDQIVLMGFSAGGQLAMVSQEHLEENLFGDLGDPYVADEIDLNYSGKVNLLCLNYPCYSISLESDTPNKKNAFLGAYNTAENRAAYTTWLNVKEDTCPVFLSQAKDDISVPIDYTYQLEAALKEKNIPLDVHYYEKGGHGYALGNNDETKTWTASLKEYMKAIFA